MGVLKTIASKAAAPFAAVGGAVAGLWDRWNGSGFGRLGFFLPGARLNYEREAGRLWQNSIVSLGLKWKADRYPIPRLHVAKIGARGEHKPLPRHGLVDLWERPNPHYDRMVLEVAVGLSLDVDGNGFVWKRRSRLGKVVELWWIPHWLVAPLYPADGSEYLTAWRVTVGGQQYDVLPEDMIHFRVGIDPDNDRLGLAALKAQLREVCAVNEESGYTASLLHNCGVPGLVVTPKTDTGKIDKDAGAVIKTQLRDTVTGDRRGEPLVLTGAVSLNTIGFSPEQLRLDKLTLAAQARLAAALGVALMSLGLPDPNKTYSNLKEADRASWATIKATQTRIARTLRWQLLLDFGSDPYGYVVEYDYSDIMELNEDLDSLHSRARENYKAGVWTKNEARDSIGSDPDPDGDIFYPGTGGGEPLPLPTSGKPPANTPPDVPDDAGDQPADVAEPANGKSKAWRY
jgi:HK97 family phage portal protein